MIKIIETEYSTIIDGVKVQITEKVHHKDNRIYKREFYYDPPVPTKDQDQKGNK